MLGKAGQNIHRKNLSKELIENTSQKNGSKKIAKINPFKEIVEKSLQEM